MEDHEIDFSSLPVVEIWWLDHASMGGPGWQPIHEVQEWATEEPLLGVTVGFLLYSCDSHIVLIDTIMNSESTGSAHKIVRRDIVKERYLSHGLGSPPSTSA